ncbi:nucleotide exchange factor GrpE [Bifidobacterium jacchi]|uniref:Nucleotide exchange factor GrpE n=1 Tax=Bifidobacterium jacchi TaxID=2490545 RepID=A0A5N5RCY2_9BIFI|nr:nucleotide exchange factor GrpE [Bifidobacterium jacchi]KAB5604754.1 nucleotide exchange factor GrpE [Bifidobacterium jacchi]
MADFEIEFMKIQRNLISLCVNAVSGKAIKVIYVFVGMDGSTREFNFFYRTDSKVASSLTVIGNRETCFDLLDKGRSIAEEIIPLCKSNGMKIPTEIKMMYFLDTGSFDSDVTYDPKPFETNGGEYFNPFMSWFQDEKKKWNRSDSVSASMSVGIDNDAPVVIESESGVIAELSINAETLKQSIDDIRELFNERIVGDKYEQDMFDHAHSELVDFQNGSVDKRIDDIAIDLIRLIDSTRKHIRTFESVKPNADNYRRMLGILSGAAEDLQDILYGHDVENYIVPKGPIDHSRQKVIRIVPTANKAADGKIAARVDEGYERDGEVIRPERVLEYRYDKSFAAKQTDISAQDGDK